MNSRERVQKAITYGSPDRIPIMHLTLIGAWEKYGDRLPQLYERYPADIINLTSTDSDEYGPSARLGIRDAWGALWVRLGSEFKGQVVEHPLADWQSLESYRFPDPLDLCCPKTA